MSTKERIERLRDELRRLSVNPAKAYRLRSDIERIKRQIAMLTEDERKPMPLPEVERRAYK